MQTNKTWTNHWTFLEHSGKIMENSWNIQKPKQYFNKIPKIFIISFRILPNLNQEPRTIGKNEALLLFHFNFRYKTDCIMFVILRPGKALVENHLVSNKLNVNKPHTSSDNCEAMYPFHDKDPSLKQLPGVKLLLGAPNQQMWPKKSITTKKSIFNAVFELQISKLLCCLFTFSLFETI